MSVTMALLLVLGAFGLVGVLVDMAIRAAKAIVKIRSDERDDIFHDGWTKGFTAGSGSDEAMKRIARRKDRLGR